MSELQEKLRRRSILNGEAAPTEGEIVAPVVHDLPPAPAHGEDPAASELKQKLLRRSIINGEAAPIEGLEITPVMHEMDVLDKEVIVISDELKDKLVHRRTVNGEGDTVKELTKEVEIFQLFRQESQFNGNPLNSPKRADNTTIAFDNPTASLRDEEAKETLGHKLRVCEAILRRKTLTEMEEEAKKAMELEGSAPDEGAVEGAEN
eukprot:gene28847-34816_t